MKNRSFTIIELMIVIIIIGVLAAAGIGKYASFATDARVKTCMGNQAQLCQAMQVWQTKKIQVPRDVVNNAAGGNYVYFRADTGQSMGANLPGPVLTEWNADQMAVRNIIDDVNVFRCPENSSRRPEPRGMAANGSRNPGGYDVYYWFRDYYNADWTPPNTDTSYVTCCSWGRNIGPWPDSQRRTQHMPGRTAEN